MGIFVKLRWNVEVQHTPCAQENYRNTAPGYIQRSSDVGRLDKMRTRTGKSTIRLEFLHCGISGAYKEQLLLLKSNTRLQNRHEASFGWMVSCGSGRRTDFALSIVELIDGRRRKVEICSWNTSKPHSLPTQFHQ